MIRDILGSLFMPHLIAFFVLARIAMFELQHDRNNTFVQDMHCLWVWMCPRWARMIAHPLYWAAAGIVTAFFLIDPIRRIFA